MKTFFLSLSLVGLVALSSCGGNYEVTFINGTKNKVGVYLQREEPKRPLKFADAEVKSFVTMTGQGPILENKKVAIFNEDKDDLLFIQVVQYPKKKGKFIRETFMGDYQMYMLVTDKAIEQITVNKADALLKK